MERICDLNECSKAWLNLVPIDRIAPKYDNLFKDKRGSLDSWEYVRLCDTHYRMLRRADGLELEYKMVKGKLRAYIKTEVF